LKVPFRNRYSFWESASESSPVGRDDCAVHFAQITRLNLRCRTRTRVAEKRPASHTNALGSLFIAEDGRKAQQFFQEGGSLGSWYVLATDVKLEIRYILPEQLEQRDALNGRSKGIVREREFPGLSFHMMSQAKPLKAVANSVALFATEIVLLRLLPQSDCDLNREFLCTLDKHIGM
jgi:hypothetical protein